MIRGHLLSQKMRLAPNSFEFKFKHKEEHGLTTSKNMKNRDAAAGPMQSKVFSSCEAPNLENKKAQNSPVDWKTQSASSLHVGPWGCFWKFEG